MYPSLLLAGRTPPSHLAVGPGWAEAVTLGGRCPVSSSVSADWPRSSDRGCLCPVREARAGALLGGVRLDPQGHAHEALWKFLLQTLEGGALVPAHVAPDREPVLLQASAGCQSARARAAVHSMLGVSSSAAASSRPEAPGRREASELQEHTW